MTTTVQNTDEKEDITQKSDLDGVLKQFESTLKALSKSITIIPKLKANNTQSAQIAKVLANSLSELQKKAKGINTTVKAIKDGNDSSALYAIVDEITQEEEINDFEEYSHPHTKQHYYAGPNHYHYLTQRGKIQAQYIWIGGTGLDMRCKTKTLPRKVTNIKDLPMWNYDGSSTGQAKGNYSEVWLKPVKFVPDPFRRGNNLLVLCETLDAKTRKPILSNKRGSALKIFNNKKVSSEKPWFGIEQEYTLFEKDGKTPLGWPKDGYPGPQGPYYCSVGTRKAFGRDIVEAHYRACLYANINISGINAEVMPGQWEFQIGPCLGIDSGDSLWLARYLLERVAEEFDIVVSFDVKPVPGDWNGAGCHTNYSTKSMRNQKGGMNAILDGIKKMKLRHNKHMKVYGKGNEKRLTGKHETQKFDEFSYGVADRGASIRIPRQCEIDKCGYFEDRRPGANMDPYEVTSLIAETTILYDGKNDE